MNEIKKPSIVFMGTPEFGIPAMEMIHNEFGIRAVITAPDKPKGRGKKVQPSPVKVAAMNLGIPVLQPERMKDPAFLDQLHAIDPDIIAIIAFRILPEEVWACSKLGTFNIHASMLPKYRGAAPINWAIINGEKRTGLTSFLLAQKIDTGNVIMQHEFSIPDNATAGDLHDLMMHIAADMALETCRLLLSGEYRAYSQDHQKATPAPKIFPDFCKIKWTMHAKDLRNFIHGLSPHPGAWTIWGNKRLKILRAEFTACGVSEPGTFFIKDGKFFIHASKGLISVTELQPQGKRAMKTKEFLAGYRGESSGKFE